MVFNRNISVYFPAFFLKGRTDYLLKAVDTMLLPKTGILWLFVQTTGIYLLICSLVIFLNEDRNNESLEANCVFTEHSHTIWERFMQTSKQGKRTNPSITKLKHRLFFQGMSKAFLSDGQSQL